MKRKQHKLKRTGPYSPVIAVLGGKNILDSMPVDYGTVIGSQEVAPKTNTKVMVKSRIRRIFTKSEE